MLVKTFTQRANKPSQVEVLEADINRWLSSHPDVIVRRVERLAQPGFGWSYLSVSVWYDQEE